jgi:hypothetical protein
MKKLILFAVVALVVAMGASASAEVQDVEVGGMVRFRTELWNQIGFDEDSPSDDFTSSTIRIDVGAELTDGVSAFIQLQQIDIWGSDMNVGFPGHQKYDAGPIPGRGSLTGIPQGLEDEDEISVYQGYVTLEDVGAYEGLSMRVGRQEIVAGTEFFFGNNDFGAGLSYDAVTATYAQDDLQLLTFVAKLAEGRTNGGQQSDDDIDLYGIYGTYTGMEDMVVDAYFALLRSGDLNDTDQLPIPGGADPTDDPLYLYTLGARVGGLYEALDYNVEGALQFGDNGWGGDYNGSALDAGVGYTFDYDTNPRLGFNWTFSSGDDDENDDDIETFLAPFSDNYHRYGYMDLFGLGNLNVLRLSGTCEPAEKIGLGAHVLHFLAVEHEDEVAPFNGAGRDTADDDTVGTELDLVATYAYSEDLQFEAAWAYFWAGDYIKDVFGKDDDMSRLYVQGKLLF